MRPDPDVGLGSNTSLINGLTVEVQRKPSLGERGTWQQNGRGAKAGVLQSADVTGSE